MSARSIPASSPNGEDLPAGAGAVGETTGAAGAGGLGATGDTGKADATATGGAGGGWTGGTAQRAPGAGGGAEAAALAARGGTRRGGRWDGLCGHRGSHGLFGDRSRLQEVLAQRRFDVSDELTQHRRGPRWGLGSRLGDRNGLGRGRPGHSSR